VDDALRPFYFENNSTELTVNSINLTVERLEEFTEYVVMVNASTSVGTGPGAVISIKTLQDGRKCVCFWVLDLCGIVNVCMCMCMPVGRRGSGMYRNVCVGSVIQQPHYFSRFALKTALSKEPCTPCSDLQIMAR